MSAATLEARELGRGFSPAVPAAQQTFRAALEAMSRPGRIQTLPAEVLQGIEPPGLSPALTALLLTLLDAEVSVWLHPQLATRGAPAYLRFHTGVRLSEQAEGADFVVLPAAAARPGSWLAVHPGTDTRPESAGTLILDAQALTAEGPLRLRGPGIEHEHRLGMAGLTPAHEAPFWQARPWPETNFPLGVDLMLCAGTQIAAVPRSTVLTLEV
jgi:alpha-D-ribose 1-methylphosphonate 5-triphosphate synthase subunit PhnH